MERRNKCKKKKQLLLKDGAEPCDFFLFFSSLLAASQLDESASVASWHILNAKKKAKQIAGIFEYAKVLCQTVSQTRESGMLRWEIYHISTYVCV